MNTFMAISPAFLGRFCQCLEKLGSAGQRSDCMIKLCLNLQKSVKKKWSLYQTILYFKNDVEKKLWKTQEKMTLKLSSPNAFTTKESEILLIGIKLKISLAFIVLT